MTTVLESLNKALHRVMEKDNRIVVLGEDILDPYGGAFKVTRGLSSKFPDRIYSTPISEACIVGMASGMAMRGLKPVAEIMFGDFVTLIADQLINHAVKFRWMYNDNVRVPIVVRTPMGGRRGYGPTHSQSLEKLFLGVPGMKVLAPNTLRDPGELLLAAIEDEDPVLFVEHKLLYSRPMLEVGKGDLKEFELQPVGTPYTTEILTIPGHPAQITIATYGYNFEIARSAALELLMEHELFTELVVFSQLSPFHLGPLIDRVRQTQALITIEEGTLTSGWGAEVAARVLEDCSDSQRYQLRRVAGRDLPIANAKSLEDAILPSVQDIVEVALSMVDR